MPNLTDKYSFYEFAANHSVASTLLYGYLGDKVSDEKKMELLQKLLLPHNIEQVQEDDVRSTVGHRFDHVLDKSNESAISTETHSQEIPGVPYWLQTGAGKYYTDPDMEGVLGVYDDGMKEVLDLLDENEKNIQFSDPNAQNHYQLLKGILKNSYDGTLISKMSEDPAYGTAIAMTAKIGFETHMPTYDEAQGKMIMTTNARPVKEVLRATEELGLLQAMAGSTRVSEKLQENISNGNVSRQELLHECQEQSKRLDKAMEMTHEQVEALRKKNILQNDVTEFTGGSRGISHAVYDMKAKQDILKAGYPTEDISVMSAFNVQMNLYFKNVEEKQAALDESMRGKPNADEEQRKEWEERQKEIDNMKQVADDMNKAWDEATNSANGPLTQEKRVENLGKLKTEAQKAVDRGLIHGCLRHYADRIDKRVNAELTAGDKAMMAGNYTEMYNALQEADPRTLLTGSKQFKELKQSVKELAEMEQKLTPEEREFNLDFRAKRREVLEKSQTYLRYKNRQMNGPDGYKHKRSDLETKRVKAVDAVYSRLLSDIERDTPDLRLTESEMTIEPSVKDNDILTPGQSGEAKDFDAYLRQHTGKGAMNGTKEEMVDDMAKVLAAQIMPRQDPPKEFDAKVIDAAAGQIKKKFNLAQMDTLEIREALDNPRAVKEMAQKNHRKTYSVDPENYANYLNDMKRLYRDMEKPDGSNKEYQRIYDDVRKIAHLPSDPEAEGLSMQKVGKLIEQTNSDIYEAMDRYVDKNAKTMGPNDPKVLQVLSAMSDAVPGTEKRADRMVEQIRNVKGVTDISDPEYIEMDEYARNKSYGLEKTADKVQISKDYRKEVMKGLEPDEREKLARTKEQSQKEMRAKEAPDATLKGKKLEGVNVDNAKKSKEVGDKATKNAVKETKQKRAAGKKVDDGVYL